MLAEARDRLAPASPETAVVELAACLELVAGAGMSDDRSASWMAVAQQTVGHYPADILRAACIEARRTADHPAKIVPTIVRAAEPALARRYAALKEAEEAARPKSLPRDLVPPQAITALVKAIGRGPQAIEKVIRDVEARRQP